MDYAAFLDDYRAFIDALPGSVNLPNGWYQNWRGWDMWQCLQVGIGDTVLDTGALHTFGCLYWAARGAQVTAVDSYYWAKREALHGLMTPYEWECVVGCTSGGAVIPQKADITAVPYGDGVFDTVLCISTIEHIPDDRAALAELVRVVKPGGHVLLTTEYHAANGKPYSETDATYYRVYDFSTLMGLLDGYMVASLVYDEPREPFTTVFVDIEKGEA